MSPVSYQPARFRTRRASFWARSLSAAGGLALFVGLLVGPLPVAAATAATAQTGPVGTPLAATAPAVSVDPTTAIVGAPVTLRGSGWTPGAQLTARLYQANNLNGPGADLTTAFGVAADGTFAVQGTVPPTLFGAGNRGNVEVGPGAYTIVVRQGTDASATTALTVIARSVAPAVPHDARYFPETRYRIDDDAIWSYFRARGGVETFGFPVSRTFTFLGCRTQIFQRQVAQVCEGRGPALVNVLDPEIFPYTRVNGSTFPAPDEQLKAATPKVGEPGYAEQILDFVRANTADTWQGMPVKFRQAFFSTVTPDLAGTADPGLLGLMALEVWGAPISSPMADPNNPEFVYQRFQRGILHYDASTGQTHGILLADYLKQILIGAGNNPHLPPDLTEQARDSRYFAQYCPGSPNWLCRPDQLPATDLTFAFEPG